MATLVLTLLMGFAGLLAAWVVTATLAANAPAILSALSGKGAFPDAAADAREASVVPITVRWQPRGQTRVITPFKPAPAAWRAAA